MKFIFCVILLLKSFSLNAHPDHAKFDIFDVYKVKGNYSIALDIRVFIVDQSNLNQKNYNLIKSEINNLITSGKVDIKNIRNNKAFELLLKSKMKKYEINIDKIIYGQSEIIIN